MRETARPQIQGQNSPRSLGYEVQSAPKSAPRSPSASLFPSGVFIQQLFPGTHLMVEGARVRPRLNQDTSVLE